MNRVLLVCPTYAVEGVPQIWPETQASIAALTAPEGVELVIETPMNNPYPGEGHRNTLHQYNVARQDALSGGYDALLAVEHDMIVPPDALIKLWQTDAPVVYALYVLRHGSNLVNLMTHNGNKNMGESFSLHGREYSEAVKRGAVEVSGVGFGCTLIRREALQAHSFHGMEESYAPDYGFAVDCLRGGTRQYARFDVVCGHIDPEANCVLWPKNGTMNTIKCKIYQPFVGVGVDGSRKYIPGEVVDVPLTVANDYMRAGFLEFVEPSVKIANKPKQAGKAVK